MKVKSDDRTVSEILSGYFFRVPRFQRPYEWTAVEVDEFWADVNGADEDYFIGSMVMFQSTHGVQGIVDGQQRITTITLLLCALRDALREANLEDEAEGLHNLVERRNVRDNQSHFVLQTDLDNPFLRFIQDKAETVEPVISDRERRLKAAFERIRTSISRLANQAGGKDRLIELREKILGLRLITIEVDNEEDATVIFQTLNSRGRDLETADLVKSHLFSSLRVNNAANDPPRDKWESIVESFSVSRADLAMDRFLLHSWLSRRDYLAQSALGKTVRKTIKKSDAQSFLDELVLDARLYREIHEPAVRASWQQEERPIKDALEALQLFRVRQPMPWLLAIWRAYDQKKLRLKHVVPAIQAVERFHFIATAVTSQPSSGGVSKMYASYARQLTSAPSASRKISVIRELNAKLAAPERLPSLDLFIAGFLDIKSSKIYTQQSRLSRYILNRIHAYETSSPADFSLLTVEHVAAQASVKKKLRPSDIARLGNLLLIPDELNETLADKDFVEKVKMMSDAKSSGVHIDDFVLTSTQWNADTIRERTRRMARTAYEEIWELNSISIP